MACVKVSPEKMRQDSWKLTHLAAVDCYKQQAIKQVKEEAFEKELKDGEESVRRAKNLYTGYTRYTRSTGRQAEPSTHVAMLVSAQETYIRLLKRLLKRKGLCVAELKNRVKDCNEQLDDVNALIIDVEKDDDQKAVKIDEQAAVIDEQAAVIKQQHATQQAQASMIKLLWCALVITYVISYPTIVKNMITIVCYIFLEVMSFTTETMFGYMY